MRREFIQRPTATSTLMMTGQRRFLIEKRSIDYESVVKHFAERLRKYPRKTRDCGSNHTCLLQRKGVEEPLKVGKPLVITRRSTPVRMSHLLETFLYSHYYN